MTPNTMTLDEVRSAIITMDADDPPRTWRDDCVIGRHKKHGWWVAFRHSSYHYLRTNGRWGRGTCGGLNPDGWFKTKREAMTTLANSKPLRGYMLQSYSNSYPATIDGAAAAMPDGWTWERWNGSWAAFHDGACHDVNVFDTDNELLDRYRLALACRLAEVKQ